MILIGRGLDQEAEKQGRLVSTTDREEPKEPLDTDLLRNVKRSGQLELCSCKGAYQGVSGRKEAGRKRKAAE